MRIQQTLEAWSNSHVFYDMYTHQSEEGSDSVVGEAELRWREELVNKSPNGHLLTENSIFKLMRRTRKLHLLHITTNLDRMLEHKVLYPSGGCLVGSIYCTPLIPTKQGLRMHNLGSYIYEREAPRSLISKGMDARMVKAAVIELTYPKDAYRGLTGIDYLRLGNVHLQIFKELEYLLSMQERHQLEDRIISRIKNSAEFLSLCNKMLYKDQRITGDEFVALLVRAIDQLPILGYLYFEVVSEYMMLYSTDKFSAACGKKGELNSWGYKELLFTVQPSLRTNFNLGQFKPGISRIAKTLNGVRAEGLTDINAPDLAEYVKQRLSFLVNARLFNNTAGLINWSRMKWEFQEAADTVGPLLGHLVHRELRNFGRYPDFYFYFDQYKALQAWNYWNHMGVVAPFNGIIPKGEIGPNPAYPDLSYKIYNGKVQNEGGELYVELGKQLDLAIAPRLIDLKYTFMRNATKAGENT